MLFSSLKLFLKYCSESCPLGTIEQLYAADIDGLSLKTSTPPTCVNCPSGFWKNTFGYVPLPVLDKCNACGAGLYDDTAGSGSSLGVCKKCDAGQYQSGTGKTLCLDCNPGSKGPTVGLKECMTCDKGQHQNESGKIHCELCTEGKYSSGKGTVICLD
jgi:hypothetical protein